MGDRGRRGHRGSVVITEHAVPVVYRSWREWRVHCRTRDVGPTPPVAARSVTSTEFCATCWGNGRILRPAGNGEGLIPTGCRPCHGTGQVATA
jgi:hypothetical protein